MYKGICEGDLIEFKRGVYSHWGVYIGNGKIVHLTGDAVAASSAVSSCVINISGINYTTAIVKCDDLKDVAQGGTWKVNNSSDGKMKARSKKDIVAFAKAEIGKTFKYSIMLQNCEHFAKNCRYGKAKSDQAEAVVNGIIGTAATAVAAAAATAVATAVGSAIRRS